MRQAGLEAGLGYGGDRKWSKTDTISFCYPIGLEAMEIAQTLG